MEARFSGCAVVTHCLPHTPIQIFFRLILVHKKIWYCLSSSNIQIGVLAVTFCITLIYKIYTSNFFDSNFIFLILHATCTSHHVQLV